MIRVSSWTHGAAMCRSTTAYSPLRGEERGAERQQERRLQFGSAGMVLSCLFGAVIGRFAIPVNPNESQIGATLKSQRQLASVALSSEKTWVLPIPSAKQLVGTMDTLIGEQFKWDDWKPWHAKYSQFFADNFTYDYGYPKSVDPNPCTLCHLDIPGTMKGLKKGDAPYHGMKSWWSGEHIPWNVAFPSSRFAGGVGNIFAGFEDKVTLTTYAKSVFVNDFKGIPHTPTAAKRKELGIDEHTPIQMTIVDLDFYHVGYDVNSGEQRILYNWCDGDLYGMIVQTGRELLNATGLPQGLWYAPRTMEGIPAPFSEYATPEKTREANSVVEATFRDLFLGPSPGEGAEEYLKRLFTPDAAFYFNPYGIGFADTPAKIVKKVLKPLIWTPFSGKRVEFDMAFCESHVCGAHGHVVGKHSGDFMGIVPNGKESEIQIRFGCHLILAKQPTLKMKDGYCIFELLGVSLQMGRNLIEEAQQYE